MCYALNTGGRERYVLCFKYGKERGVCAVL